MINGYYLWKSNVVNDYNRRNTRPEEALNDYESHNTNSKVQLIDVNGKAVIKV